MITKVTRDSFGVTIWMPGIEVVYTQPFAPKGEYGWVKKKMYWFKRTKLLANAEKFFPTLLDQLEIGSEAEMQLIPTKV